MGTQDDCHNDEDPEMDLSIGRVGDDYDRRLKDIKMAEKILIEARISKC